MAMVGGQTLGVSYGGKKVCAWLKIKISLQKKWLSLIHGVIMVWIACWQGYFLYFLFFVLHLLLFFGLTDCQIYLLPAAACRWHHPMGWHHLTLLHCYIATIPFHFCVVVQNDTALNRSFILCKVYNRLHFFEAVVGLSQVMEIDGCS